MRNFSLLSFQASVQQRLNDIYGILELGDDTIPACLIDFERVSDSRINCKMFHLPGENDVFVKNTDVTNKNPYKPGAEMVSRAVEIVKDEKVSNSSFFCGEKIFFYSGHSLRGLEVD